MAACRILVELEAEFIDLRPRMTASPLGTYENDLVGNRTKWSHDSTNDFTSWDLLNRMQTWHRGLVLSTQSVVTYQYRADGMRTRKTDAWSSPTSETKFYYDGQMGVQDTLAVTGGDTTVTKYGIGARGIDVITKKVNGGSESFGYPIYDPDFGSGAGTHGNMVATLARSGSNSYSTGNAQTYDVWGGVRSGSSTEDQGYVANLGHRRDSESSLTYMRARYYEPSTGRFVSEDPAQSGSNWYAYGNNAPSFQVDKGGTFAVPAWMGPLSNHLWLFSFVMNVQALVNSIAALARFVARVQEARDGNDVENAFGKFMKSFKYNFLSDLHDNGAVSNGLTLLQSSLNTLIGIGRSATIGGVGKTVLSGAFYGMQLAILGLAYTLRLSWYLSDIE